MNQAEMRTLFLSNLGLVTGDIDPTVIDIYLQKVWQRDIPNRIGESASEGYIEFNFIVDQSEYTYLAIESTGDDLIRSVAGPVRLGTNKLTIYTDTSHFYDNYPTETDGTPLAVLAFGRELRFMPIPQATTLCRVYCHLYREPFSATGIIEDTEAFAVVYGAVMMKAGEDGQDNIQERYNGLYRISLAELASKYQSGVRVSKPPGDRW